MADTDTPDGAGTIHRYTKARKGLGAEGKVRFILKITLPGGEVVLWRGFKTEEARQVALDAYREANLALSFTIRDT